MDDDLYRVPLDEFTAARDALAARLKAAGDKEAAAQTKRARKPSVPAWAANQVVWHAPTEWERLRAAAHALRQKHEKAVSPEALREGGREQREALLACEAWAAERLAQHGHAVGPAVVQKVGHTLLALAYGAPGVEPGRLEHELQPPGFEAFAGLTLPEPRPRAAPPVPEARPAPAREPVANEAARRKADEKAEAQDRARRQAALAAAEARHAEEARALLKARDRLTSEEKRVLALETQLETARRACDEARRQLEAAEAESAAADVALEAARSASSKE